MTTAQDVEKPTVISREQDRMSVCAGRLSLFRMCGGRLLIIDEPQSVGTIPPRAQRRHQSFSSRCFAFGRYVGQHKKPLQPDLPVWARQGL